MVAATCYNLSNLLSHISRTTRSADTFIEIEASIAWFGTSLTNIKLI